MTHVDRDSEPRLERSSRRCAPRPALVGVRLPNGSDPLGCAAARRLRRSRAGLARGARGSGGPTPLNIFRTLAHAETCLRPALRLGQAILTRQELDAVLRELAILRVAQLTGAQYEWVQHVAIGRAVGVTGDQVAALEREDVEAECFATALA